MLASAASFDPGGSSPSVAASWRRTAQSVSSSRFITAPAIGWFGIRSHRSDNRNADTRTSRFVCDNAGVTSLGSIASKRVEHPERLQTRARIGRAQRQLAQRGHNRLVAALDEQLLRHVAAPSIRMRQQRHELGRRGPSPRIGSGVVSRFVLSWMMR